QLISELIRENNIKIMLRSETKRREAAVNGSANSDVDGYASDIKSLSARLQQIRHYLRQAAQLRRSVGGRQGRNLDSLMQQLAAQERHCSAALEDRLRRHAVIDMAADQQSDGERDSEDVGDQDDADEDGDADEDVEVESKGRPTIESKLGRHPDTADTSQCGEDDSERGVDVDSGEELEALRNQRDLLRRMLQPAGSQQPQQHRQLPALPASNQQVASAGAPSEDALVKRLMDLESRRARLDQTLEELADLRADASTTSTEVQAAAGSFSARQTAGEAAQLLGAMETMQARLDRLRSVRDRLESVRQLADDYRRSGTSLSTNQSGGGGGQNGDDDGDGGNAEASAAERELRQLVLERQRLTDLAQQSAFSAAESETDNSEAHSQQGFDRLRSSIYSEVAAVISQNESRPHYLIELFRELQLLSTDRLRQRALQQLQRLVNGYLASRPPWLRDSDDGDGEGDYDRGAVAVVVDVEQTPSESYATTTTSAAAEEATAEAPFARDSLGDTAINLDRAMRQVRQHQQQQRQHLLSSSSSGGRAAVAAGASASGRIDAEQLDRQVKSVVRHLIPALRARAQEVATPQLLKWVADLALQRVKLILDPSATGDEAGSSAASTASAASKDSEFDQFFARQLSSLLADSLARFRGHRLADCTEDMLVDLSELLFNELAFFRLVNNLDISNDDVPAAAGGDTDSVATEDVAANKAENEDTGQDEEEPDNGEETEGGDGEESEAETASAKAVEDYADDFEEAATSSDAEAAGAAVQNHEKESREQQSNGEIVADEEVKADDS
uniref:PCM1_C domain-containing protein n=1 Tax=Macrostomum lignano TaxID=282301 RepID=A0A1I8HEE5_9PLAT